MILADHTITAFAQALKDKAKLPATIESYCRDAREFLGFLEQRNIAPTQVEPKTLLAFQEHLSAVDRDRTNSVRRKVIGVKQFYRFLVENQSLRNTPFDEVPIPTRLELMPKNEALEKVEGLVAAVAKDNSSLKGSRNFAIILLLAHEGLKAHEVIELEWRDFFCGRDLATLTVRGSRARIMTLENTTAAAILTYKKHFDQISELRPHRDPTVRMFVAFQGRDETPLPRMTRHGLKFLIYECGDEVGINHCNTELLRHFAISRQLSANRSPEQIMNHLGLRRLGIVGKHAHRQKLEIDSDYGN